MIRPNGQEYFGNRDHDDLVRQDENWRHYIEVWAFGGKPMSVGAKPGLNNVFLTMPSGWSLAVKDPRGYRKLRIYFEEIPCCNFAGCHGEPMKDDVYCEKHFKQKEQMI
jgi:hypothetical protein